MERLHQFVNRHNPNVKIYKKHGTKVLWRNNFVDKCRSLTNDEFLNNFSFNTLPLDYVVDEHLLSEAQVERYGGRGIGVHGGGARAIIIDGSIVKGSGCNPLTGEGADKLHSSGRLNIYSAVNEIVLSNLLNNLLPLGAANIHGLIYLDPAGDEYQGRSCASVLLVREQCLRLGNLLAPQNFRPQSKTLRPLILAQHAVRDIHLDIEEKVGARNLVSILGVCLQNQARQFAFSRFSLLAHNGVSESNLCFDGRWIDVHMAGFVNSGKNYLQASSFYSEHEIVINFIAEFAYTYSKYVKKLFNPKPLIDYYISQFGAFQKIYAGYYFGFSDEMMHLSASIPEWDDIYQRVQNIVVRDFEYEVSRPAYTDSDELIVYIQNLYLGAVDFTQRPNLYEYEFRDKNIKLFLIVLDNIFEEFGSSYPKINFIKFLYINSILRFYCKQFFHSDTLPTETFNRCDNLDEVNNYIENMDHLSRYTKNYTAINSVCIYDSSDACIEYRTTEGGFCISISGVEYFETCADGILKYIDMTVAPSDVSSYTFRQRVLVQTIIKKFKAVNFE